MPADVAPAVRNVEPAQAKPTEEEAAEGQEEGNEPRNEDEDGEDIDSEDDDGSGSDIDIDMDIEIDSFGDDGSMAL